MRWYRGHWTKNNGKRVWSKKTSKYRRKMKKLKRQAKADQVTDDRRRTI